jgi:DinB superfamily
MLDPLVRALVAHVDSVFEGPNGDYPSVLEALAGLTVNQAMWKPSPESNSIWQIVDHLTASKEWQMEMIAKGQASSPVWTEPAGDETAWQKSVARLHEAHARLKMMLGQLRDEELLKSPTPDLDRTLLELLLSSGSAHEAHHSGQIDYLKGLQSK